MAKLKMLQVEESTHKQTKKQAEKLGISIKDYIQTLIDADDALKVEKYVCKEFDLKFADERLDKSVKQHKNGRTFIITIRDK